MIKATTGRPAALLRRAATALLAGFVAAHGAAGAPQPDSNAAKVVALGFGAASQTLYKATTEAIYLSSDEGRTWTRLARPQPAAGRIAAVAISAKDDRVLYVAGPSLGVLSSADGGGSWAARNKGLPSKQVIALAVHADRPDTVFAYVAARGIYRSEDAGGTWRLMDRGPRDRIQQLVHSNMPGSMQTGWFFAATAKGVSRAMDCFCGWRDAGGLGRDARAVAFDPHEPRQVYAATDEGLFLSKDGGEQWTHVNAPASGIAALVGTPSGALYAATRDGGLFRSKDQGKTWDRVDA